MKNGCTQKELEELGFIIEGDKAIRKSKISSYPEPSVVENNKVKNLVNNEYSTPLLLPKPLKTIIIRVDHPIHITPLFVFDIVPIPAPRLVHSDKWKKRPIAIRYFEYKERIKALALELGYELTPVLNILFIMPMPRTWTYKKKESLVNMPHQQTPDIDNLIKGTMDSMITQDNFVWSINASKIWGERGCIIIF